MVDTALGRLRAISSLMIREQLQSETGLTVNAWRLQLQHVEAIVIFGAFSANIKDNYQVEMVFIRNT